MDKKQNWVFLEALLITVVVFIIGLYAGINFETDRMNQVNNYYIESEVSLVDTLALSNLEKSNVVSCEALVEANKDLLNKIYEEASTLDRYDNSNTLTDNLETFHRKYDILRTYLWINLRELKKSCGNDFSTMVYLYNNNEEDLTKKAENNVWSKLLLEVKNENENTILIPISYDGNLTALRTILEPYNLTSLPATVINDETIFYKIPEKEEIINLVK